MSTFPSSGETLQLTADEYAATNYVLRDGQTGVETDTGKTKVGDGTTPWADLEYVPIEDALPAMGAEAAEEGTDETPMLVSPKVLNEEIARQIAAALEVEE